MTNFNGLGHFFARFFNAPQQHQMPQNPNAPANMPANAQNVNNAGVNPQLMWQRLADAPAPVFMKTSDILQNQQELAALTNSETTKYLKDVMQLPREFSMLIDTMLQKNQSGLISINQLKAMLQANGKNALNDVVKVISEMSRQGIYKTEQLSEILKIINNAIPGQDTNSAQVLKNIILLYLPWLPLGANIDFELRFGAEGQDGEATEGSYITIIIQTVHYGLIKVILALDVEDQTKVCMKISCPEEFPKDELQKNMSEQTLAYNVQTSVQYETIKLQRQKLKDNQPKVDMHSSNEINPYLMIAAQSIIRQIIDIDKRAELQSRRKSMVD